jgi:flagellar hook-length control protein FliK
MEIERAYDEEEIEIYNDYKHKENNEYDNEYGEDFDLSQNENNNIENKKIKIIQEENYEENEDNTDIERNAQRTDINIVNNNNINSNNNDSISFNNNREDKEFKNTANNNLVKENNSEENKNLKQTEENQEVKKIILPKSFKKFKEDIQKYEQTINVLNDDGFVKEALKKALLEKLNKVSEEEGENFANKLIEEIKQEDKYAFNRVIEKKFFSNLDEKIDLEEIADIEIDLEKLKKESIFDINVIYQQYAEIFKENENLKEFFENLKIDFFVEDFFII